MSTVSGINAMMSAIGTTTPAKRELNEARLGVLARMGDLLTGVKTPGQISINFDDNGGYRLRVQSGNTAVDQQLTREIQTLFAGDKQLSGLLAKLPNAAPKTGDILPAEAAPPENAGLYQSNEYGDTVTISRSGMDQYRADSSRKADVEGMTVATGINAVAGAFGSEAAESVTADRLYSLAGLDDLMSSINAISTETEETRGQKAANIWKTTGFVHRLAGTAEKEYVLGRATNKQKETSEAIRSALKEAGINLRDNEKFSLTVKSDGSIKVDGLKDPVKARRIETALAQQPDLVRDLRQQNLLGNVAQSLKMNQKLVPPTPGDGPQHLYYEETYALSGGSRYGLMAGYLQERYGLDLDGISLVKTAGADGAESLSLSGANEKLLKDLAGDEELMRGLYNVLENRPEGGYETAEVTVEFANGMVADGTLTEAARKNADQMQQALVGRMGLFNRALMGDVFGPGVIPTNPDKIMFEQYQTQKFNMNSLEILLDSDGNLTYSGRMGEKNDTGTGAEDALNKWFKEFMDSGLATGIFEQMMVSHQVEYGDVDDFEHKAQVSLTAEGVSMEVSSPEADREVMEVAERSAERIGSAVGQAMRDQGFAGETAFDIQLTADGHLVAGGMNPDDPFREALQGLLDAANDGDAADALVAKSEQVADRDGGKTDKASLEERERRRNGFMKPMEESAAASEARQRRADDKERGKYVEDRWGFADAGWVEGKTKSGGMPETHGIDEVAVLPEPDPEADDAAMGAGQLKDLAAVAETTAEAEVLPVAANSAEKPDYPPGRGRVGVQIKGTDYPAGIAAVETMDTGLSEFSIAVDDRAKELDVLTQQLLEDPDNPQLLKAAASALAEWVQQLHDPAALESLRFA